MLIWILFGVLFVSLSLIGFYQGAIRAGVSLIGLVVAAVLARPLGPVFNWVLGLFNFDHPVLLAFVGPVLAFIVVLLCFQGGALALHKQVDTYYKYKASDTLRLLYDRLNSRVGIAVGLVNAYVYLLLLSVVIYIAGYFLVQTRTGDRDGFVFRTMTALAKDLRETKMDQAVAAFLPQARLYYDGSDIVASIFLNPLLQNRISTYPPFLLLNEKSEYRQIASNTEFQDFWQKSPTIQEWRSHDRIKYFVENPEWYRGMKKSLNDDFGDFKHYLETGQSPKFDEETVLGRWDYDGAASFALARKQRPNMPLQEIKRLRLLLGVLFKDAQLTCAPENKVVIKLPNLRLPNGTTKGTQTGAWEKGSGGSYTIRVEEGSQELKVEALVEGRKLTLKYAGSTLIFEK